MYHESLAATAKLRSFYDEVNFACSIFPLRGTRSIAPLVQRVQTVEVVEIVY
jgi:hypothetical protein